MRPSPRDVPIVWTWPRLTWEKASLVRADFAMSTPSPPVDGELVFAWARTGASAIAELAAHTSVPAIFVTCTTTSPRIARTAFSPVGNVDVAKRDWIWTISSAIWFEAPETSERCTRLTRAKPVKVSTTAIARTKNSVRRARIDS